MFAVFQEERAANQATEYIVSIMNTKLFVLSLLLGMSSLSVMAQAESGSAGAVPVIEAAAALAACAVLGI